MKKTPKPVTAKPHKGWKFFVLYRTKNYKGEHYQGTPYEVLAKNQKEAQALFAKYLKRTPPLQNVLDYSDMIGVWQWIAAMKPRVVRDFEKVSTEKAWKR